MSEDLQRRVGVWFVYDGECPLCSMAAHALRIRQDHGPLHMIDARQDRDSALLQEIRARGLDLDEGMVILAGGEYLHGRDALTFMARYGETQGWFNKVTRALFRSDAAARLGYPWLRAVRNGLIRMRGVGRINNLSRPGRSR